MAKSRRGKASKTTANAPKRKSVKGMPRMKMMSDAEMGDMMSRHPEGMPKMRRRKA